MAPGLRAMAGWTGALRRLAKDTAGSSAAEFAIIVPILLALTMGAIDGGRAMLTFNSIEKLAKDGARFASVRGSEYSSPATQTDIANHVKSRATGLDDTKIAVAVTWAPNNDPGSAVAVRVTYAFDTLFLPFATVNFDRSSTLSIMR